MSTPTQASLEALIQQALHIATDIAQAEASLVDHADASQLTVAQWLPLLIIPCSNQTL